MGFLTEDRRLVSDLDLVPARCAAAGEICLSGRQVTNRPNKAPEPTPGPVTPRARGSACDLERRGGARVAPVPVVAHL